ncbi:MAG: MBL fold metallo-hydrolase [Anaerolineae bacterium]|nr:MBL fold metallo-hydrolase [Anaerolineae bacterium]
MSLEIKVLTLGVAATNCYLVGDPESGTAVIVDPVDNAPLLLQTARDAGWQIKLILATHGHYDHVLASHDVKAATGAPFFIHHATPQVYNPDDPLIRQLFPPIPTPDRLLPDVPETIEVGPIRLETLFTPGHAPDHLCFYMREYGVLFGGDCLFAGSIGRTDLPYGDYGILMQSIFDQLIPLGDAVQVLPGHMKPTTIGHERMNNPFLLDYADSYPSKH